MLSGARGLQRVVVHLESGPSYLQTLVTKASSAPTPHYVRRGRVCMGNQGLRLGAAEAIGFGWHSASRQLRLGKVPKYPKDEFRLRMEVQTRRPNETSVQFQ